MPKSRSVPDVQVKRKLWNANISRYKADVLVFLDESGVNTSITRLYGRALSCERSVGNAPPNTPTTTPILSSIRINGETARTAYQGGTAAVKFCNYLKYVLFPTLDEHSIVVMDNMQSHHVKVVKELLDKNISTISICYLIART